MAEHKDKDKEKDKDKDKKVEVWLIEDNQVFRRTVQRVINHLEGLNCARGFASCEEALALMRSGELPGVILLDVGLPGMSGIEGIFKIKELSPKTSVIILTVFDDDDKIFRAICAGASGYLLKTSPIEQISEAIREVLSGGAPINARIAKRVLDMFSRLNPPKTDYGLSPRETEILERLTQGRIKKEIAAELNLSYHTVDTHLRNIYSKLEVNTRTGAVAKALKEKLI